MNNHKTKVLGISKEEKMVWNCAFCEVERSKEHKEWCPSSDSPKSIKFGKKLKNGKVINLADSSHRINSGVSSEKIL